MSLVCHRREKSPQGRKVEEETRIDYSECGGAQKKIHEGGDKRGGRNAGNYRGNGTVVGGTERGKKNSLRGTGRRVWVVSILVPDIYIGRGREERIEAARATTRELVWARGDTRPDKKGRLYSARMVRRDGEGGGVRRNT